MSELKSFLMRRYNSGYVPIPASHFASPLPAKHISRPRATANPGKFCTVPDSTRRCRSGYFAIPTSTFILSSADHSPRPNVAPSSGVATAAKCPSPRYAMTPPALTCSSFSLTTPPGQDSLSSPRAPGLQEAGKPGMLQSPASRWISVFANYFSQTGKRG